jgi:hypothetical protein
MTYHDWLQYGRHVSLRPREGFNCHGCVVHSDEIGISVWVVQMGCDTLKVPESRFWPWSSVQSIGKACLNADAKAKLTNNEEA